MSEHAKQTHRIARNISGYFSITEGYALYHLASRVQRPIVEIGCLLGRSTIWLARGSQIGAGVPVITIDNFVGVPEKEAAPRPKHSYRSTAKIVRSGSGRKRKPPVRPGGMTPLSIRETFERNIEAAGVADIVTLIPKASKQALKGSPKKIGLLFIDGCHDYEGVRLDYELYAPRVVDGGWIAFHDSNWPGPSRLISEEITAKAGYGAPRRSEGQNDSLLFVQKLGAVVDAK